MSIKAELRRLRELDWRELDVREAGSWPLSLQLLCYALVLVVIFWAMHGYVVAPKIEALEQVKVQERELLSQFESKSYQAANLPIMHEQMDALESRMDALLEMLPTGAEVPSLIDNISETALDNQLTIDFIRLREPMPREFYTEQPFDIQVRGDYHRIGAFISGVASLPRIVTLHDFSLVPLEGEDTLQLSMLAKTYNHRSVTKEDAQ